MTNHGKANLFKKAATAVVDEDNPHAAAVIEPTSGLDYEVETYELQQGATALYQSDEARDAATRSEVVVTQELKQARIEAPEMPRQVAVNSSAQFNKLVKVRPRQTVNRFKVGRDWYQIEAGRDVLVPKHVATLLEQKGLL